MIHGHVTLFLSYNINNKKNHFNFTGYYCGHGLIGGNMVQSKRKCPGWFQSHCLGLFSCLFWKYVQDNPMQGLGLALPNMFSIQILKL